MHHAFRHRFLTIEEKSLYTEEELQKTYFRITVKYISMVLRTEDADLISRWVSKNIFASDNLPKASKNSRWVSAFNPPLIVSLTSLAILKYSNVLPTSSKVLLIFCFAIIYQVVDSSMGLYNNKNFPLESSYITVYVLSLFAP